MFQRIKPVSSQELLLQGFVASGGDVIQRLMKTLRQLKFFQEPAIGERRKEVRKQPNQQME